MADNTHTAPYVDDAMSKTDLELTRRMGEEMANDPVYSLRISDLRIELSNLILKASPAMVNAVASIMHVGRGKGDRK